MSLLRIGVLGLGGGLVNLGLQACLDDVEGTRDGACESARRGAREELQRHADIAALLVPPGPGLELLPEHELQGGEGQISVEGRLVSVEERGRALDAHDGAGGVDGAAVVVSRLEMRVVVSALELEAGLEDFGGDVDEGGRQIAEETCQEKTSVLDS